MSDRDEPEVIRPAIAGADERYRGLFENSPVSLWEEDFSELKTFLDDLRGEGVKDFAVYFDEHPEVLRNCASLVKVVDVNEATLALLECGDPAELLGRLPVIFRESTYEVFREEVLSLLGGQTVVELDTTNRTFQGREIDVRVRLTLAPGCEEDWSQVFISLTDITELKQHQRRLILQGAAMEAAADAIFITDTDGRIQWVNRAFSRLSGFAPEDAVGQTPGILNSGRHEESYFQELWQTLMGGDTYRGRTINRRQDGELFTVDQTITPIAAEGGSITHFVAVQQDVTETLESERQLIRLATLDSLTELPNRFTFNDRLEREAIRAMRQSTPVAVLMLDIDHFKDINDAFGHVVGDAFLVAVARRLHDSLRQVDTLARLGGDEFAVIQTDVKQPDNSAVLGQRLLALLSNPLEVEGYTISTSASIGISFAGEGEIDPKRLISQADMALYRAKHEGRATIRFHSAEMDEEVRERLALGQDLRLAVERDELFLEYQPQIELSTRTIVGLETLVRWRHPERGVVSPQVFIPIAENNGQIMAIGEWVLRNACRELVRLRQAHDQELWLAVNLSAVEMRSPGFADTVLGILGANKLPPSALELELTETVLMHRTRQLDESLDRLQGAGIRFSVDDFGTGYSSMVYLRQFKVDKLKIDRSFLEEVETSANDAAIVNAIIALGGKLGLQVVAEGAERETQVEFLRRNGCDLIQGYYFSRPISAEALGRLLAEGDERITARRS